MRRLVPGHPCKKHRVRSRCHDQTGKTNRLYVLGVGGAVRHRCLAEIVVLMGEVVKKPVAILDTPEGRLFATEVDGAIVHGCKPLSLESEAAMREIIKAVKKKLAG